MQPILWEALSSTEVGHEAIDNKMRGQAWKDLKEKGEPLHQAIEKSIEQRLHSHAKSKIEA